VSKIYLKEVNMETTLDRLTQTPEHFFNDVLLSSENLLVASDKGKLSNNKRRRMESIK
jgi:hypothetical protein